MVLKVWLSIIALFTGIQLFYVEPTESVKIQLNNWKYIKGDNAAYSEVKFSDSSWSTITVPSVWEKAGYPDYDGIGWYRTSINIPSHLENQSFILHLGKVDDNEECYFNGKLIGASEGWETYREYNIPHSIIKFNGNNIVAIKVVDTGGDGGMYDKVPEIIAGYKTVFNVDEY